MLQASPPLGPLEALQVSATLGLLKSARFHQLRAPREGQVSPTLAPRKLQVSPTLGPSQAAGFSYFGTRLHTFCVNSTMDQALQTPDSIHLYSELHVPGSPFHLYSEPP